MTVLDLPRCLVHDEELRPCIRHTGHRPSNLHHFRGDDRPTRLIRRTPEGPGRRDRLSLVRTSRVADYPRVLS